VVAKFCSKKLQELIAFVQFQPVIICICVVNVLFSLVAIIGNLFVIRALWKASSITVTLKNMFLSLAFCDPTVGLFSNPTG